VNTKGNATIRLEPEPNGKYEITADGNISCRLFPGASADVKLKSSTQSIRVKIPDISNTFEMDEYSLKIGDGGSKIILDAQGRVNFITYRVDDSLGDDFEYEFEENFSHLADEITQQITEQIESQMDSLSSHLDEITAGISIGTATSERSRRKLEAKRRSLEHKLRHAQNKVDRKMRAAEAKRRVYQHRKPSDPVTDEERKIILEMLQSQQINVEEAETLLIHRPVCPKCSEDIQ